MSNVFPIILGFFEITTPIAERTYWTHILFFPASKEETLKHHKKTNMFALAAILIFSLLVLLYQFQNFFSTFNGMVFASVQENRTAEDICIMEECLTSGQSPSDNQSFQKFHVNFPPRFSRRIQLSFSVRCIHIQPRPSSLPPGTN